MKKHEIISPQSRAVLFDPPTDPTAIVRHYTFSVKIWHGFDVDAGTQIGWGSLSSLHTSVIPAAS